MRNGQQPKSQGQIEPGEECKAILTLRVYNLSLSSKGIYLSLSSKSIYLSRRKSWGIQLHFWWFCKPREIKIKTQELPKSETLINHPFKAKTPKDFTSKVKVKQKQTIFNIKLQCSFATSGMPRETQPQEQK